MYKISCLQLLHFLHSIQEVQLPVARHLYPFQNSNISYIASAISTQPGSVERSLIGQLQEISDMADFYSKYVIHV